MTERPRNTTAAAIAVVVAPALFSAASPMRSAGNVLLWACHGPRGEALGAAPFDSSAAHNGLVSISGQGCDGPAGTGGLHATFNRPDPAGGSIAYWQLTAPNGLTLRSLRIARSTSGFGGPAVSGDPQIYETETSSTSVESSALDDPGSDVPLSGELLAPDLTGRFVRVSVSCGLGGEERCAAPPNGTVGVEVSSIALGVLDQSAPVGVVGGVQNPTAAGATLKLLLNASDTGLGLADAEASIDGRTVAFARLGSDACPEHPSTSETVDLPLAHTGCPETVSDVPLMVPVGASGSHQLQVRVSDAAGNTATLVDQTILAQSAPPQGTNTVTIGINGAGLLRARAPGAPPGGTPPGHGANGGVLGSSSGAAAVGPCRSPMLSMRLSSNPLRYTRTHHVPVLRAGRRYRYRGLLTCLPAGTRHRVSAPTGTVVQVLYRIGRRTFKAGRGTMTVHRGHLSALLGYRSGRTIIFRYRQGNGENVQVRIRTKIARRHHHRRRTGRAR